MTVPNLHKDYQQGYADGQNAATSILLGESSYGACRSAVVVIESKSRRGLTKEVKDRNWRKGGDNPGQVYGGTCQLIRALKTDEGTWVGICIASTLWDV